MERCSDYDTLRFSGRYMNCFTKSFGPWVMACASILRTLLSLSMMASQEKVPDHMQCSKDL